MGSKYKKWKFPPRLSEQALRFFAFVEGDSDLVRGQKSSRN